MSIRAELEQEQRRNEWHKATIDKLHAEVNRPRALVDEPPLASDVWHNRKHTGP